MLSSPVTPPSSTAGLDAWLSYLEALHPTAIDMGLDRVRQVAAKLDFDKNKPAVVTVAGTNGKGSTVRYIETILRCQGYRTGVYISPHIHEYRERVRVDGEWLTNADHVAAFQAIEGVRGTTSLTYFEFGTLAALWLLQRAQVDVWILEVGLGGRLDAVNIIDADVPVLTSVGIDHIGFLGSDRGGIAVEKSGIFRPHRVAICGEPDFPEVALDYCQQNKVQLRQVNHQFFYKVADDAQSWSFQGVHTQLSHLAVPQLPLPNAATALAAIEALSLPVTAEAIREGIALAREPGRLQVLAGPPEQLLDVAHNPHAAAFLCGHVQRFYQSQQRPVYAVIGMLKDKDIAGTLAALAPVVSRWFCADLGPPRGASARELAAALPPTAAEFELFSSVEAAHQAACAAALKHSSQQALVLVCGSFYTVASISTSE